MAPVFGTIAMKDKERFAIEDGLAKKARRQPSRNANKATAVDDEIPLHDQDLAKPKTSTETGRTKLATEDLLVHQLTAQSRNGHGIGAHRRAHWRRSGRERGLDHRWSLQRRDA